MSTRVFFTTNEKAALACLVKRHPAISSKETGSQAILEKKSAWIRLTEDFNMIPGNSKRTQAQLKKLWENEKMRRKKELRDEKRDVMSTGGGCFISTAPVHDAVDDVQVLDNVQDTTDIELMKQDKIIFRVRLETEIAKRETAKEQREAAKERRKADKIIGDNDIRSSELRRLILERQLNDL